jgi:hypothetical protein
MYQVKLSEFREWHKMFHFSFTYKTIRWNQEYLIPINSNITTCLCDTNRSLTILFTHTVSTATHSRVQVHVLKFFFFLLDFRSV